jgi:antitoxin CptB
MSASDADNTLENRRKRLLYQSIYRGNKENDIILGRFARAHLGSFNAAELDQYEKLLTNGDNDIFDWLSGRAEVPVEEDSPVLQQLLRFRVDLA